MFTLTERGIKLCGEVALLHRALFFQLRNVGVHLGDLRIELRQRVLRFT